MRSRFSSGRLISAHLSRAMAHMQSTKSRGSVLAAASGITHAQMPAPPHYGMTSLRALATAGSTYVTDLPKLPVSSLQQTKDTFLKTVRPLASSDAEFQRISKLAAEFVKPGGDAEKLQKGLEQRAGSRDNWLAEWWDNIAYLEYREPNALVVSPGYAARFNDSIKTGDDQLRYASKALVGALLYKERMDRGGVPQEMLGSHPLCMSQYFKLWSVCRIPQRGRDKIHLPTPGHKARNIMVLHNNHIFSVDVYDKDGNPLSPEHVYQQLKLVVDQSLERGPGLGIMTTENRDTWADVYNELTKDPENSSHFGTVHDSILALCLDGEVPNIEDENVRVNHAAHGNGSKVASGNRWFDKILQLIVTKNGLLGQTCEHSTSDGPPLLASIMNVLQFLDNEVDVASGPPVSEPRRLDFNLSKSVGNSVETARQNFDKLIAEFELHIQHVPEFGKNLLKKSKFSPDAFVQVAVQLGYYRFHGQPAPTYESGSIRRFSHGRTETIRSCSIASHAYCQAMAGEIVTSQQDKYRLLKNAIDAHRAYTNMALSGHGIDRHMLGLKLIAQEAGLPVPELLTDSMTEKAAHWKLSTSQVATPDGAFSFAPVVPDGYGVCYSPRVNDVTLNITAWRSCPETDPRAFGRSVHQAMLDGRDLLLLSSSGRVDGSRL